MSNSALEAYLPGVDARAVPIIRALDRVIMSTRPDFDVAIKYRVLGCALRGDWRRWVCAIDARRTSVCLRFLYGVLLDDPQHVLRAGSSVLKTWDFAFDDVIDPAAVGAYVAEAVAKYNDYKANERVVLEASRSRCRQGGPATEGEQLTGTLGPPDPWVGADACSRRDALRAASHNSAARHEPNRHSQWQMCHPMTPNQESGPDSVSPDDHSDETGHPVFDAPAPPSPSP